MDAVLERATQRELAQLVEFCKTMVVKKQEVADQAETDAIVSSGESYAVDAEAQARDWRQQVVYITVAGGTVEKTRGRSWVLRETGAAETVAVSPDYGVWRQQPDGVWVNISSGASVPIRPASWTEVAVPDGEVYIDPTNARALYPVVMWVDALTGDVSASGPVGANQFVTDTTTSTKPRPPGLSDLIPTSQEYVAARLMAAAGVCEDEMAVSPGVSRAALTAALASYEQYGEWEDPREPLLLFDEYGRVVTGSDGRPSLNPNRVVSLPWRGEMNSYYRSLVRDHGIDPFMARTAEQFEMIKWGRADGMAYEDRKKFAEVYGECVRVFKSAFYNEAMEGDPLYYNFCRMFISWMAINQAMNARMTTIGDVNRMTQYEITNLLYSFGIYQFDDMPIAYKRRFAKNLERIMADKGTASAFEAILEIFNLEKNVTIWKHYLVKFFPKRSTKFTFPRAINAARGERYQIADQNGVRYVGRTLAELKQALEDTGLYEVTVLASGVGVEVSHKEQEA